MTIVPFAVPQKSGADVPELHERGAPGTGYWAGFITTEEYVPELLMPRGLDTFERMRRSDGMVAGTLRSIKLPLLSATWEIAPASEDEADVTVAAFVRWNLFEGMSMTWQAHLRHVLMELDFGFYIAEKVWEIREDLRITADVYAAGPEESPGARAPRELVMDRPIVVLRKLAPRLQRTITKWNLADDGGLRTVQQQIQSGTPRTAEIPIEKLLVFVNEKEGANWWGRSAIRPAYKHWYIKDQLYRIQAIAAERHGVGVPVWSLPEDKDDATNMKRAEDIVYNVRTHEQGGIVEPFGHKFRLEGMLGRPLDVLPMIQHHDRMIAVSVLAQFLTLGERREGSFALSEDQSSLFLMVEKALGDDIAEIHNRYLIPQLVDFNFAGVSRYPRLVVKAIDTRAQGPIPDEPSPAPPPDPDEDDTLPPKEDPDAAR